MIRKKIIRMVFVIEISQNNKILGYYAGRDEGGNVIIKDFLGAKIIKSEERISHIVANLEKQYGETYSFRVAEVIKRQTKEFYDAYEEVDGAERFFLIMVKGKRNLLAPACFVNEIDWNKPSFKFSLDIEKAMLLTDEKSEKVYKFLSYHFPEEYKFYQVRLFVKKTKITYHLFV